MWRATARQRPALWPRGRGSRAGPCGWRKTDNRFRSARGGRWRRGRNVHLRSATTRGGWSQEAPSPASERRFSQRPIGRQAAGIGWRGRFRRGRPSFLHRPDSLSRAHGTRQRRNSCALWGISTRLFSAFPRRPASGAGRRSFPCPIRRQARDTLPPESFPPAEQCGPRRRDSPFPARGF